jgi:hypothetical protein
MLAKLVIFDLFLHKITLFTTFIHFLGHSYFSTGQKGGKTVDCSLFQAFLGCG